MVAIAPNLTTLVGELVGARLISHAGSLMNLAKHPASTVQILGAEKALFKALKTKHDTPKYGLIYHAQLVGQTTTALKGKVSRMLAAKASLACRVDAFSEDTTSSIEIGMEQRLKVEARINQLEGGNKYRVSGTGKQAAKFDKYEAKGDVLEYKAAADNTMAAPQKRKLIEEVGDDAQDKNMTAAGESSEAPKKKKKKKEKDSEAQELPEKLPEQTISESGDTEKLKKKKKKSKEVDDSEVAKEEQESAENQEDAPSKKKKKHKHNLANGEGPDTTTEEPVVQKKKKKKDKSE